MRDVYGDVGRSTENGERERTLVLDEWVQAAASTTTWAT